MRIDAQKLFRLERHANGPRVHVLGHRIHEFQLGFGLLLAAAATAIVWPLWSVGIEAAGGFWLVVKDWPDLFPSTRDTACWRMGIHRPPAAPWRTRRGNVPTA